MVPFKWLWTNLIAAWKETPTEALAQLGLAKDL
jgi:hypothetical protein